MVKEQEESKVSAAAADASISVEQVRRLIEMMDSSDVHELTIERESEGLRLTLRKPTPVVGAAPLMATAEAEGVSPDAAGPEAAPESAEKTPSAPETLQKVTATLVGLFRVSLKRGARAAVSVGSQVRAGQIVGAIEALNVMNEVETPVAGRVVEIVVKDGQPVEYGQHLMTIDTSA